MIEDAREISELAGRLRQRVEAWKRSEGFTAEAGPIPTAADLAEVDAAAARLEQMAQQVVRQVDELAGSQYGDDRFISNLGHQLRMPLTPVLLIISSLQENPNLPHEIQAELSVVREQIELEARLVNGLLDAAQLKRHKLRLQLEDVDLRPLLLGVMSAEQASAGQRLEMSLDFSAGRSRVQGDPARLRQIFVNLLRNAVKFTPAGGKVSVTAREAGENIVIEVSDTGQGFNQAKLPGFFEAFGEKPDGEQPGGGLGLGLPIARGLVELHGGQLTAISEGAGRGSKFTVTLPLASKEALRASTPAPIAPARTGTAEPPRRRGLRVLLVEDHSQSRRATARLLGTLGYRVQTAEGYTDAVTRLNSEPFDLLISDIELPDGTGWNLMKAAQAKRPIKGLALSGYGSEEDLRKSQESGFAAHLVKPITLQRLTEAIEAAVTPRL